MRIANFVAAIAPAALSAVTPAASAPSFTPVLQLCIVSVRVAT
jgi:hypothetical protein